MPGVEAGATLVQGTINGYGERVGNANLVTILPNLALKMGRTAPLREEPARSCGTSPSSSTSSRTSGPIPKAPFVGQSAFAHKGGLHANAAQKVARSYEHIDPALVGNRTRVLVSDMAGRSSLALKAREFGMDLDEKSPELKGLIEELKEREFRGYEYEAADASFKLLVARKLGRNKEFFEVEGYRVIVERHGAEIWSEATVRVKVAGRVGPHGRGIHRADRGARQGAAPRPREDLSPAPVDDAARLQGAHPRGQREQGTGSKTRVLVESGDGHSIWGTVGVSDNLIDASWEALREAVEYRLSIAPKP